VTAGHYVREWGEYARWRARLLNDARKAGAFDMIDMAPEFQSVGETRPRYVPRRSAVPGFLFDPTEQRKRAEQRSTD
jgi:hypothetical protein